MVAARPTRSQQSTGNKSVNRDWSYTHGFGGFLPCKRESNFLIVRLHGDLLCLGCDCLMPLPESFGSELLQREAIRAGPAAEQAQCNVERSLRARH